MLAIWVCVFCMQKTAYEMRISDWSSDVCASDLRATCLLAAFGYGRDDAFGHIAFELAGRIVIKKEKRLRSLYYQVVDAHGDKVDSHAVMSVMIDRKFQLRTDPVIGRNQKRVLVSSSFQIEKAAQRSDEHTSEHKS